MFGKFEELQVNSINIIVSTTTLRASECVNHDIRTWMTRWQTELPRVVTGDSMHAV